MEFLRDGVVISEITLGTIPAGSKHSTQNGTMLLLGLRHPTSLSGVLVEVIKDDETFGGTSGINFEPRFLSTQIYYDDFDANFEYGVFLDLSVDAAQADYNGAPFSLRVSRGSTVLLTTPVTVTVGTTAPPEPVVNQLPASLNVAIVNTLPASMNVPLVNSLPAELSVAEVTSFDLEVDVTYEVGAHFDLRASVPSSELTFRLWVDVPKPEGERIGGLLVSVPWSLT